MDITAFWVKGVCVPFYIEDALWIFQQSTSLQPTQTIIMNGSPKLGSLASPTEYLMLVMRTLQQIIISQLIHVITFLLNCR